MEIGDQPVDDLEAVAGGNEDVGFGGADADRAIIVASRFERAQAGGADGNDAAATAAGAAAMRASIPPATTKAIVAKRWSLSRASPPAARAARMGVGMSRGSTGGSTSRSSGS